MIATEQPPAAALVLALDVARLSPCRSKRGVSLWRATRSPFRAKLLAAGFNAPPAGAAICAGSAACKATCARTAVHAEQRALLDALSHGVDVAGAQMLHVKVDAQTGDLVASPGPSCVECSKLALGARITGFWLYHVDGWRRYAIDDFHALTLAANGLARKIAS